MFPHRPEHRMLRRLRAWSRSTPETDAFFRCAFWSAALCALWSTLLLLTARLNCVWLIVFLFAAGPVLPCCFWPCDLLLTEEAVAALLELQVGPDNESVIDGQTWTECVFFILCSPFWSSHLRCLVTLTAEFDQLHCIAMEKRDENAEIWEKNNQSFLTCKTGIWGIHVWETLAELVVMELKLCVSCILVLFSISIFSSTSFHPSIHLLNLLIPALRVTGSTNFDWKLGVES